MATDSTSRRAGGLLDSVRRLAQSQAAAGDDVTIHTIADEHTLADQAAWNPLQVCAMKRLGPEAFGYAPGLIDSIVGARPQIIYSHGIWKFVSVATVLAATRVRCPWVVHTHGMLDSWALGRSRVKKAMARWAYENRNLRGAACIRALNEEEAGSIRTLGLRNPIAILPNGIDLPTVSAEIESEARALLPGRRVLLYLGRLHPKKGLPSLLQAWSRLLARGAAGADREGWTLVVAGWDQGQHERDLRRLTEQLGLGESQVRFVGPQFGADKAKWYRRCNAFVLPSLSEGLPMVVLEAWAYAKPVICTPQCNLPSGARAGAAIVVAPDSERLGIALETMLSMSDAEREEMGERGIRLVREQFSWPQISAAMSQVNRWVVGGGAAPEVLRVD